MAEQRQRPVLKLKLKLGGLRLLKASGIVRSSVPAHGCAILARPIIYFCLYNRELSHTLIKCECTSRMVASCFDMLPSACSLPSSLLQQPFKHNVAPLPFHKHAGPPVADEVLSSDLWQTQQLLGYAPRGSTPSEIGALVLPWPCIPHPWTGAYIMCGLLR